MRTNIALARAREEWQVWTQQTSLAAVSGRTKCEKEANMIDREDIIRLTEEYGGRWGINHTRRLLHLISIIGQDQEYNADAVWLAAHLLGDFAPATESDEEHSHPSGGCYP